MLTKIKSYTTLQPHRINLNDRVVDFTNKIKLCYTYRNKISVEIRDTIRTDVVLSDTIDYFILFELVDNANTN